MSSSPKNKLKMPPGYKVIRGNVVEIVDRVERELNRRTRHVERSRKWREMTLQEAGGQEHMFVGEVLDGARHGDDVAVVWAPVGREPVALANLTAQYLHLHGSADPDTPEGKLPTAFLVAVVGALPGLLVYYAILAVFFPNMSASMSATALKFYPFVLLPAAWWFSTRLTGWARDRTERVSDEIEQALIAAGITSDTKVRDILGVRQVALA